jgi:hypothetical protein
MRAGRERSSAPIRVSIVSANDETLDGLQAYLRRAGLDAKGSREVDSGASTDPPPGAVVFFPDEFSIERVVDAVKRLHSKRPRAIVVLVTREPQRFEKAFEGVGGVFQPLVVAKPAWGWTILDAICGRLEAE